MTNSRATAAGRDGGPLLVLGVGPTGARVCRWLASARVRGLDVAVVDCDEEALARFGVGERLFIGSAFRACRRMPR